MRTYQQPLVVAAGEAVVRRQHLQAVAVGGRVMMGVWRLCAYVFIMNSK